MNANETRSLGHSATIKNHSMRSEWARVVTAAIREARQYILNQIQSIDFPKIRLPHRRNEQFSKVNRRGICASTRQLTKRTAGLQAK